MDRRLIALPLLMTLACAEADADAEVTVERSTDSGVSSEWVDRVQREMVGLGLPEDVDDEHGIILSENEDGRGSDWVVLQPDGQQVLLSIASHCRGEDEGGDSTWESDLWQLLDPGDLVEWTTDGNDDLVCSDEIDVVEKAAVTR